MPCGFNCIDPRSFLAQLILRPAVLSFPEFTMKLQSLSASLILSLFASAAFAQVPATAPAGTTGMCKDGSFSNAASKAGACSGHKGIKTWYAAEPAKADKKAEEKTDKKAEVKAEAKAEAKADKKALEKKGDVKEDKKAEPVKAAVSATAAATPATAPASAPAAAKSAPATAPATAPTASTTAKAAPAAGAAAGNVWVNTDTKVYHCPGTRYYGKTKDGSYMTEADRKSVV